MLEGFFWISVLLFLHPYTTYPLSLIGLRLMGVPRRCATARGTDDSLLLELPQVCVLVVAHNEEREIRARIENLLLLEYPDDKIELFIVSDGSTDRTDQIVVEFGDRVRWLHSPERVGKAQCVNLGLKEIQSEIVVFTDANTEFAKDAVMQLVRPLLDLSVGFVVGIQGYRTTRDAPAEYSESSYSSYETWLRRLEGRLGAVVGGDGAIMAVRRDLIEELHPDDVSDLRIPLDCIVKGFRGHFQPNAQGWEVAPHAFRRQFHRKTRIVHRSILTMSRNLGVLNPFRTGWFPYFAISHKALRWFGPALLIVALASSLILVWGGQLYYGWFIVGLCLWLGIGAGYGVRWLRRNRIVYLSFYFWLIQLAALIAILRLHRRDYYTLWEPARD